MRFAARELKPHAEPVDEALLVEGHTYFAVQFLDCELRVPVMEPLVFLGRTDLATGHGQGLLFRSAQMSSLDSDEVVYTQEPGQCQHIFEFEQALNVLLRCSIRRSANGIAN